MTWLIHLKWLGISSYCLIPDSTGKDKWEGIGPVVTAGHLFPRAGETETSVQHSKPTWSLPRLPFSRTSNSQSIYLYSNMLSWVEDKKKKNHSKPNEKYVHVRLLQIGSSSFTYVTPGKLPRMAHSSRHTSCRCSRLLKHTSIFSSFSLSLKPPSAPRFPSAYFIFSKIYSNTIMTSYL